MGTCRNGNSKKPTEAHFGEQIPAVAHLGSGSGRGGVVASLTGELARLRRLIVSRSEELWLRLLSTVQASPPSALCPANKIKKQLAKLLISQCSNSKFAACF